jgi:hypothetical protein
MRRHEIIDARQTKPFHPFRIYVSDGSTFDVRHPEMLMVTEHSVVVGLAGNGRSGTSTPEYPAIERHTVVDLLHITRIEEIDTPSPHRPGRPGEG